MWKSDVLVGFATAIIAVPTGHLLAKSVCYEKTPSVGVPADVFRIDVKYHSTLTTRREHREFGDAHPRQTTYSAQGKSVYDDLGVGYILGTLDGSITVAKGSGARMGLQNAEVNDYVGFQLSSYGCRSDEASATPETWSCEGFSMVGGAVPASESLTLTRVNPLENHHCSWFSLYVDCPYGCD